MGGGNKLQKKIPRIFFQKCDLGLLFFNTQFEREQKLIHKPTNNQTTKPNKQHRNHEFNYRTTPKTVGVEGKEDRKAFNKSLTAWKDWKWRNNCC